MDGLRRWGGREGGGDPLARSASEGRMNFVTPRTELRLPSVYQGRDKAQKEQQDWRARGEGVMSPLHARTALARGPACGWRDSPYNCQACLTATVRSPKRVAENSALLPQSARHTSDTGSPHPTHCVRHCPNGIRAPPALLASSWNFRFTLAPNVGHHLRDGSISAPAHVSVL